MKEYTKEELLQLKHNDHRKAILNYIKGTRHIRDKQDFLFNWVKPAPDETILECGSSSGKTCIDFTKRIGCKMIGIDFSEEAIKTSTEMQQVYFPALKETCFFRHNDLTKMFFDKTINKILMPDFSEHIPDSVFSDILNNIKKSLPSVKLYIYTPVRTHIFEILKHNNILLKNPEGHINVKTEKELILFLQQMGWKIIEHKWRPSHLPIIRNFESLLGHIPVIGKYFHRKAAILAIPT